MKRAMQQFGVSLRQVGMMVETDTEVWMKSLITGSLILLAAVALLATGCDKAARAPEEWTPGSGNPSSYRGDATEVVVTAPRPAWVMPVVVVCANSMPEVVVHASWCPMPVAAVARPTSIVN